MAVVGTRGRRMLGMRTRGRWSTNNEIGALIRDGGDMVQGEGGRNMTRDPIMNKVGPDIRWKTLEESST